MYQLEIPRNSVRDGANEPSGRASRVSSTLLPECNAATMTAVKPAMIAPHSLGLAVRYCGVCPAQSADRFRQLSSGPTRFTSFRGEEIAE